MREKISGKNLWPLLVLLLVVCACKQAQQPTPAKAETAESKTEPVKAEPARPPVVKHSLSLVYHGAFNGELYECG